MALRWPHLQLIQADPRLQLARDALDSAAHSAADVAGLYLTSEPAPSLPGDTSPFLLPWFYMSGIRCIETKAEVDLGLIEAALGRLRCKWKAAGTSTSKRYYRLLQWRCISFFSHAVSFFPSVLSWGQYAYLTRSP